MPSISRLAGSRATLRLEGVRKAYGVGTPLETEVLHGIDLHVEVEMRDGGLRGEEARGNDLAHGGELDALVAPQRHVKRRAIFGKVHALAREQVLDRRGERRSHALGVGDAADILLHRAHRVAPAMLLPQCVGQQQMLDLKESLSR